jgi:hypothetical protein
MSDRYFFHSFPRPKADELAANTLERGLLILEFMKQIGLVLAPEIVKWSIDIGGGAKDEFSILQQRACFTELETTQLPAHNIVFGPISLSFDIGKLRAAGAMPVIYVPQGVMDNPLSQIGVFAVRGAYHTKYVYERLQALKEICDPQIAVRKFGQPLDKIFLKNHDPTGKVVAEYEVPASNINDLMQHIGYRNIPFDHSIGVLSILASMFYPTDNTYAGDQLGYYRQREWRVIGGLNLNSRPMGRKLNGQEEAGLKSIDNQFWTREIEVPTLEASEPDRQKRVSLALVYDPIEGYNFFDFVEAVYVPKAAEDRARAIVGEKVRVLTTGKNPGSSKPWYKKCHLFEYVKAFGPQPW